MFTDEFDKKPPYGSGGRVDFWPKGDRVEVCDSSPDGRTVLATVADGHGNIYDIDAKKFGDCRECDASSGPHTNLRENAGITVQIRLIDSRGRTVPGSYDRAGWRNYNDAEADCE